MQRKRLLTIATVVLLSGVATAEPKPAELVTRSQTLTLQGQWDAASAELLSAISRAEGSKDLKSESLLRTEYARGLVDRDFFHHDDRAAAASALDAAEKSARRTKNRKSLTDLLQLRGQYIYKDSFENNDWQTPRSYFERTVAAREKSGDRRGLALSNFYLGLTYDQDRHPEKALPLYRKALTLAEETGDKIAQSYAHRHIAGIEEEQPEMLDSAYQHILREIELRKEGGFLVGVPFSLLHLADFLAQKRNQREQAISTLKEAVTLARSSNSLKALLFAQASLAELKGQADAGR